MNFEELAHSRHSAIKFQENVVIPKEDYEKIFRLVQLSPSAYNLQHAHFIVIDDKEKKQLIKELSFNQYKIGVSSAVILVYGNKEAGDDAERIFEPMKLLRMIDEFEYEDTVRNIHALYESLSAERKIQEAVLNAGLAAMSLMYAAKHYGYDTCPMHIHSTDKLKTLFNVPDNYVPVMMITIGVSPENRERARGFRKPINEFTSFNNFK